MQFTHLKLEALQTDYFASALMLWVPERGHLFKWQWLLMTGMALCIETQFGDTAIHIQKSHVVDYCSLQQMQSYSLNSNWVESYELLCICQSSSSAVRVA